MRFYLIANRYLINTFVSLLARDEGITGKAYIFPHHVSWSNKLTCPSGNSVIFSHLLDNSDLFHKQAGAFSSQTGAFSSDAEVLARRTAYDTVNRFDFGTVYFANISDMLYLNLPPLGMSTSFGRRGSAVRSRHQVTSFPPFLR